VTINWNAPMAYAINALQFYQTGLPTSAEELKPMEVQALSIIPNPGRNTVYLPQINESLNQDIEIINLSGQVLYREQNVSAQHIDVSNLNAGVYIFRLSENKKISVSKWVKID